MATDQRNIPIWYFFVQVQVEFIVAFEEDDYKISYDKWIMVAILTVTTYQKSMLSQMI